MAKRKNDYGHAEFTSVVQLALMPEQVKDVEAVEADAETLLNKMCEMVDAGYKVQIAPNSRGAGYQATSMSVAMGNDDAGLMLVAKAPTAIGALAGLVYKHFFLLKEHGYAELPTSQAGSYS